MIATKANAGKQILLHIGVIDQMYTIDLWDSGTPFPKEVLCYLGKKRYTTRKKEGGSGIGLFSTYELAQKGYHTYIGHTSSDDDFLTSFMTMDSFVIDETTENIYTKKVSIIFDEKQQYRLVTRRDADEIWYLSQRKDCVIDTSCYM